MTFSNAINWLRRDGPRWENLGITLSGGTFSITQANGSALSANDPGYVTIPSKANPGQQLVYRITANQTFVDDNGTSTIIGNLFGLTTAIAFAQDIPFYIYAVSNDAATAVSFMISRIPHASVAPAAGSIGKTGSAIADTQGSFFALDDPTVANFDGNPCICIGAIRMRMSASDDWTVQALSDGSNSSGANLQADGIGCFHEGSKFSVATGQFGAASGSFFTDNGGTAPAWTTQSFTYTMLKTGFCTLAISGATSSAGAGAVNATLALPIVQINTSGTPGSFVYTNGLGNYSPNGTNNTLLHTAITSAPAFATVTNANLAVASYRGSFSYVADLV